jgi:hypothetical protein
METLFGNMVKVLEDLQAHAGDLKRRLASMLACPAASRKRQATTKRPGHRSAG